MIALARQTRSFARRLAQTGGEIWQRVSAGGPALAWADRTKPSALASSGTSYSDYELRDMMLDGRIYQASTKGGALKYVLKALGRDCVESKNPITPYFNPFGQIVRFYDHTLAGQYGKELRLADETPSTGKPPAEALKDPLARLWRWSGLDTRKPELVETTANHGACGIRVVLKGGLDPRVYLDFDDPRFIRHVDTDNRGNVTGVWLEYDLVRHDDTGAEAERVEVKEWIGKDGFSLEYDGEQQLNSAQRANPLNLCPYVLLKHDAKGRHAYHGSELAIHGICWGAQQLDESIWQHIWPTVFATSGANKPAKFTTNRHTLIYSKTEQGQPRPTLDMMVPELDLRGSLDHLRLLVEWTTERQPQLILYALKLLSGISGETLAQIKAPAESECLRARAMYESGLISALQIGLSVGVYNGLWDLGTGTDTPEAVARAYDDGTGPEAFAFAERPALPLTVYDKQQQAKADTARDAADLALAHAAEGIVDSETQLTKYLRLPPDEARAILRKLATETVAEDVKQ